MVNKLYKLHKEKAHMETVSSDPLQEDNIVHISGASKYKQKDQLTPFKIFHEGKDMYNQMKEAMN